jgi:hypothetical protein
VRIVDASIEDLNRASRRGRARSQETQQLIDAINSLTSGTAKAIMATSAEGAKKLKARIAYAGRLAGKRLQVAIDSDRVFFGLSERPARRRRRTRRAGKK